MKKGIFVLLIFVLAIGSTCADDFKIRLIENDVGYMEVQMKCVNSGTTPTTSTPISGFTFQIRWLSSLSADVDILCTSNDYNLIDGLGTLQTEGSYNFRTYAATSTPFNCPTTWITDEWETITSFIVTTGSGSGDFEVAPDLWVAQGLNWQIEDPVVFYNPDVISGISSYPFPTTIYNYVWKGGAGPPAFRTRWESSGNWEGKCPGDSPPESSWPYYGQTTSFVIVPAGLTYYPETTSGGDDFGWAANKVFIQSGAHVTVPDLATSTSNPELYIDGDLVVEGVLNLSPKGHASVTGNTTINSAEGIIVQADVTGVGSFIDNGTIAYGASGTAKVQTYLANDAGAGTFHIHLVGPAVDKTNYTGGGTGVLLSAFNVAPGFTYAYEYDEVTNTWPNLVSLSVPIPTAKGIALSTTDALDHTLEMTGELLTGAVSSEAMTTGGAGAGDNLLSNPYPSSIFWDDMYADNSTEVNDAVYVWDAGFTGGNYRAYNEGSGGTDDFTGYIQVGQGFFVESTGTSTFDFNNTQRDHSIDPFYSPRSFSNRLDVRIAGTNYRDGLLLHFYEGAHSEFEINEDIEKMDSRYDQAPEIWTDLNDGSRLSINALPFDLLNREMLSVPMSFKCGLNDSYTLSFIDVESFEYGTEIWLEDKLSEEEWVNLNKNPEYDFSGTPEDMKDRFIIHFFGPTGIGEQDALTVDIFGYRNYAYIVNHTEERITKVQIYNLSGGLVYEQRLPDQKTHKLYIDDEVGYYVVRVTTEQNIYTDKIFISF